MKTRIIFLTTGLLIFFSCKPKQPEIHSASFGPKVVEAHGYIVPRDSIVEPKVIPAGKPRVVKAGNPKVILANTNVKLAGIPKVVPAGVPRISIPGQESFSLPRTVPAIDSPFIAGIHEVTIAKDAHTKEHNAQSFSSFGILQGLKNELIRDIIEDSNGNLWFATNGGGVSKYDGKSFTHFTDKDGLSSLFVKCLLEDKNGNLWFGTWRGGVSKYDGKSFTHFTEKEGLLNNTVNCLLEDNSGNIWIGTDGGGVSKYQPAKEGQAGTFTHFTVKEGLSNDFVSSMYKDINGDLWFGTREGVSKYNASNDAASGDAGKSLPSGAVAQAGFTHFTVKEGLIDKDVRCIQGDKKGNLWIGTLGGVSKYEPAKGGQPARFTHFTIKEGLSNNLINDILEDKYGHIWFSTFNNGLNKYDGVYFTHYSEQEGLNDNEVTCILEDRSGNLWFGTHSGVCKYGGNSFTHYTEKDGLRLDRVTSIIEDKYKNLWFGMKDGGVCKYNASGNAGKYFTHFTTREGLIDNSVWIIMEDRNGNLWFGTYGGVCKYNVSADAGKSFTHFTEKNGLTNNDVKSILEDKWGNIWFGTAGGGGLCKYDGKNFTQFGPNQGLSINNVMSIEEDKSGNLWFSGYLGGVTKYDPSAGVVGGQNPPYEARFTHFTVKEGLPHNDVRIILEDKIGNLWFSTIGGGVSKYEPPMPGRTASFTHYTENEGLSNNVVGSMMEDRSGNLWFGTNSGLNKLEKEKHAINTYEYGSLFKTYSYEDGFSGIGVNYGNTICEAKDGTIWIGSNDRLTAYRPDEDTPDTVAPNIRITGLEIFNKNIAWQSIIKNMDTTIILGNGVQVHDFRFDSLSRWYSVPEHLSLNYNNNYLTFHFVGITLKYPKKVKYQHKLEGLDPNWSPLTARSEAPYGNLTPGKYTFKVKAMNDDGYWSKELDYTFTIRPPWWLTWWFRILTAVVLLSSIAAIMYLWFQFKFRQKLKVESLRQKIATDLHDEIGSNLSSMAFSAELVKKKLNGSREDIEPILNKLVSTFQETSSLISDTIWSLNPRNDSFDKLKERMENFTHDILSFKEMEYQFQANGHRPEPVLSLDQKRNIYLIYKEAITNIAKHSKASLVNIRLELLPDKLVIEVMDNGIGFDTAKTYEGNGLNNFKSRSVKDWCVVQYFSAAGKGTVVKITAKYFSLQSKPKLKHDKEKSN